MSLLTSSKLWLSLVVLAIAAAAVYFGISGGGASGPLAGVLHHDFGVIDVAPGQTVELHHTFKLSNATDRPVRILAARPDCGCVSSRIKRQTIEPGEAYDLPIIMGLQATTKHVVIYLEFEDGAVQTLQVDARARVPVGASDGDADASNPDIKS